MTLSLLLLAVVGAWAEARWPNQAGGWITVHSPGDTKPADTVWRLRHVDGVHDALAVLAGDAPLDDTEDIPWTSTALYAVQAADGEAGSPPHIPFLNMGQGRLPAPLSLDEVALSHEVAQVLRRRIGDAVLMAGRSFRVVGIGSPSTRWPGNWLQVSPTAAEGIGVASGLRVHHFAVEPDATRDAAGVAARIWQSMPDMQVMSPAAEFARARQERAMLILAACSVAALALLVSLPLLGDVARESSGMVLPAALASGAAALVFGWLATLLLNSYARDTLGLTPFRITLRLVAIVLGASACIGLLTRNRLQLRTWTLRYVITVAVLAVCGGTLVTIGALNQSLQSALSEAQQAAADWVAVDDRPVDFEMLQAMSRMPGVRGYAIEAYGGPASEDDARWLGVWPQSGVLYGVRFAGAEGTLSLPYNLGIWRGRPLDSDAWDEAVVGFDLSQAQGLEVGDRMAVRGTSLVVVGIRHRLPYNEICDANWRVDVTLNTLKRVLHDPSISGQLQLLIPPAEKQDDKAQFLVELRRRLYVSRVSTVEDRLAELAPSYPIAWTLTAASSPERVQHARSLYENTHFLSAVALLSLAGLVVTGAFAQRLADDECRVGLLKAFGMEDGKLLGGYLEQALGLGVAGGILSIGTGWVVVKLINDIAPPLGVKLLITPWLAAVVFVTLLLTAVIAVAVPASRAARRDAATVLFKRS